MQDLPVDFANYIRQMRLKYIVLHEHKTEVKCKILIRAPPKPSVKFGCGWKQFCEMHSLHEDDKLIFEAKSGKTPTDIKVLLVL